MRHTCAYAGIGNDVDTARDVQRSEKAFFMYMDDASAHIYTHMCAWLDGMCMKKALKAL